MLLKRTLVATPLAVALALAATALWAGIGISDLSITKTDGDTISLIGGSVTYTIVGTNDGPDDIFGATVTDTFPSELSGCSWSCSASAGSSCTASGSGNISDTVNLLENGTVTYTAMCSVSGSATPGSTLSNTASITSPATDPNTSNNSATDDNTLLPEADLSITKTDGVTTAVPGQPLGYTIVASNAGPMDALGATVTDTFPTELSGCTWTCAASAGSSCSAAGSGNISDSVNLLSGGSATYAATCTVDAGATGTLFNTAAISGVVFDSTPADQTATDADTVLVPTADLSITKSDSADPVAPGGAYTYTVTVNNAGPSDATSVVATDTLPAGVSFVSTSGCAEDPAGAPTCSLGTIAAGGMASYSISVTAPSSTGTVTNSVSVASAAADGNASNNTATEDTTVEDVDLSITKTDSVDPVAPSGAFAYTVTVGNAGPSDASGVVATDTLPAGVSLVSTSGCAEDPAGVPTCTLGAISSGGMASYTINVTAPATAGTVTNNASVTSSSLESTTGNNSTTEDTTVEDADLSITKTDSADPVAPGGAYTYTVTVNNAGPSDAAGVVVTDTLPAGVTLVSTSGCAEDPNGAPTCTLSTITSGGMASYTIDVTAPATPGTVTNSASATSSTTESNTSNNTTSEDTTVEDVDLSITKIDSADPVAPSGAYTYTVTVSNAGPSDAAGVVVTDNLPFGVSLVSTSGCAEDPAGAPACTLGTIVSGGMASYTIDVTAPTTPGSVTNTASVTSSSLETNTGNNSASEDTLVENADLSITKTDSADPVDIGAPYTYTVTVSNAGPSDATNVVATDTLPAGVSLVSTTGCAEDPAGAPTCSLGPIPSGSMASYTISVTAPTAAGSITNTASVTSDVLDADSGNNSASEDTLIQSSADLSITKTDGVTSATPGTTVTYTIVAANAGPSDVMGATVTDTFPTTLSCSWTCVASAGSSCTAAGTGNITDSVDLLNGGSATYAATCDIDSSATGTLSNTATISSAVTDPSPGDESATDVDTLTPSADLSITKMDSADPVQVSSPFSYTIMVSNAGPSDAVGVAVMDMLPAGVGFVDSAGCAEDPTGVPTCTLGTVAAGGSASYTINATASAVAGTVTNTATVAATTPDSNTANNGTSEDTEVLPEVTDLLITTAVVPDTANLGEPVMVDVEVSNAGPADATNVVVTTTLPTSLSFSSTVGCTEDPNGVPTCTLGSIANGDMQSFTVNATVVQVDGSSGTATASSDQSDSDTSNNSAPIVLTVGGVLSIPTASEWGLMALAFLLGAAALWRMRQS